VSIGTECFNEMMNAAFSPAWKRTAKERIILKVAEQFVEQLEDMAPEKEVWWNWPNWFGACWLRA